MRSQSILPKPQEQRLTTTGQTLGTPFSMAPEQITGQPLDGRTDVYGMGVMLYELLTGVRPFTGNSAIEVAQKALGANADASESRSFQSTQI